MLVGDVCMHIITHLNTDTPTTNHIWYVAGCRVRKKTNKKKHTEALEVPQRNMQRFGSIKWSNIRVCLMNINKCTSQISCTSRK